MSAFAEKKNEKVFEFYSCFPPEVQMVVINEMQPDDRCRFTRCSKLSNKQAKSSKHFIHGLEIFGTRDHVVDIHFSYSDAPFFGFVLRFEKENESKRLFMKYLLTCQEVELWREQLDSSTNLYQHALRYFKSYLNAYENTIKEITIYGEPLSENWNNLDLGIKRMDNLKSISVYNDFYDVGQILSKVHHPLKDLEIIYSDSNEVFSSHSEKIYQITGKLKLEDVKLNKQQFLRLSAYYIKIPIGRITEKNLFDIISLWQDRAIRMENIYYEWNLRGSKFKVKRFIRLFGAEFKERSNGIKPTLEIKHKKDDRKIAIIEYYHSVIAFYMKGCSNGPIHVQGPRFRKPAPRPARSEIRFSNSVYMRPDLRS